jgi:hypothetical protein
MTSNNKEMIAMPEKYFIDFCHYLDSDGAFASGMPKPALKLACYFALLIEEATRHEFGITVKTTYPCRKKKCRGSICMNIPSQNDPVYWVCCECLDEGCVSNWQSSKWNSRASIEAKG